MLLKFIFRRKKKHFQKESKSSSNIYNWMDLSKKERLKIDYKEKDEAMRKKQKLLKSIREEYIKIKKNKNKY